MREDLSDQWFEGAIKPALSGSYRLASSSEFYGKVSAAGERTYGSSPNVFGGDNQSFQVEDLAFGWRSGTSPGSREHVVDRGALDVRRHVHEVRCCEARANPGAAAEQAFGRTKNFSYGMVFLAYSY